MWATVAPPATTAPQSAPFRASLSTTSALPTAAASKIGAMPRASEVQEKRAELHYVNRMAAHKVKAAVRARVEIKESVDLIESSEAVKEAVMVDKLEAQKQKVNI